MKISILSRADKAYGLILVMVFIVIMLILLGATLRWASTDSQQTQQNNQYVASQYAAESALEVAVSQMDYDYLWQSMQTSSVYAVLIPTNTSGWPIQYQFTDPTGHTTNALNVVIGAPSTNLVELPSPYSGLSASVQQCEVSVTATPKNQLYNVPATVDETFEVASIPIFQFLIFYNINLEIAAAQPLVAVGPVFCNNNMWSGSTDVTFSNVVWCVGTNANGGNDPFAHNYSGSGASHYITGQPVTGKTALTLPIAGTGNTNNSATNIESILQWPPSAYGLGTANAYTTNGQVYLANVADLIISNSISGTNWGGLSAGTNFTIYYQDQNLSPSLVQLTHDFYIITNITAHTSYATNYIAPNKLTLPNTNIFYAGYTFLTNVFFYDWREGWNGGSGVNSKGKPIQAVQFSVTNFNAWLGNTNFNGTTNLNGGQYFNTLCQSSSHKSHPIDGIYIYTSVTNTSSCLPAVCVVNGAKLYDSYGLTIATPFPLYVLGNYNVMDGAGSNMGQNTVNHTRPAAFLCDAITVLSTNWSNTTISKKPGSSSMVDTVNAAIMAGIVQSDPTITTSDDATYSGGVENFLRMLETWGTLYYNGAIVVMFPSQYATNRWRQTGNYYVAPARKWAFDTNFEMQADLPPMTPQVKTFIRENWSGN